MLDIRPARDATVDAPGELVDLLCDDPDWLRAEFEAIIACSWHDEPPTRRVARSRRDHDRGPTAHLHTVVGPTQRGASCPGADGWARQRSPP